VLFLVAGADKAERLVEVLEGPADVERLPSQLLRQARGRVVWLVDEAAAARLRPPPA
jgi:6-phosphogluconolactonase